MYSFGAKVLALKKEKARKMIDGQNRAIEYLRNNIDRTASYVWIHVASLGEFEQGRPLIEMIKKKAPQYKIVLTFFSPSGYEVRKNYSEVDAVCYLPFDFKHNATLLLDVINPQMAFFVKYEFWGNYLEELHKRKIPTYLISSIFRKSQSFFKWWGGMFRKMLNCYTHIYVQDDASKQLLLGIGVSNVTVAGDTRFDRVTDIMSKTVELPLISLFKKTARRTLIVGSSWEADEDIYIRWINTHTDVKTIIAPHEFDADRLMKMCVRINGAILLSELIRKYGENGEFISSENKIDELRCVIVDCFGLLASLYRYGDIAYVGGGFGHGIHNINEAAVYGMPVIFGPKFQKFKEAKDLIENGGAFTVANELEFEEVINKLVNDGVALKDAGEIAGRYIHGNIGATEKIFSDIFNRE